jgi:3-dehydroquinate dehydratase
MIQPVDDFINNLDQEKIEKMSKQELNHINAEIARKVALQNSTKQKRSIRNINMAKYSPVSLQLNCNITEAKLCNLETCVSNVKAS